MQSWEKGAAQARAAGNLGDRALIVLTAGKALALGGPQADRGLEVFHEIWVHQLQAKLAQLSTRGQQVIVESSGHGIGQEAPDAAVSAIRQVLFDIRRK